MSKILGSRKRRFEIINNKPDHSFTGVELDNETFKFGKSGGFTLEDPAKAEAINQKYGQKGPRDVVVVDTDDVPSEPGHTYFFSMPEMPWKKNSRDRSVSADV